MAVHVHGEARRCVRHRGCLLALFVQPATVLQEISLDAGEQGLDADKVCQGVTQRVRVHLVPGVHHICGAHMVLQRDYVRDRQPANMHLEQSRGLLLVLRELDTVVFGIAGHRADARNNPTQATDGLRNHRLSAMQAAVALVQAEYQHVRHTTGHQGQALRRETDVEILAEPVHGAGVQDVQRRRPSQLRQNTAIIHEECAKP
mmetsp:Transcript_118758/g.340913  ORF Transcript_118758/g.340913 Transcript_118758/m.340913 type:complete len:203 (+) Transcript_118758:977-1585(+)